ncbi:MAG: hypothetical protein WD060_06065 [Pirellulales bacterium]
MSPIPQPVALAARDGITRHTDMAALGIAFASEGHHARHSWWDTTGKRAASWSRTAPLHEQPDQTPGHPVARRGQGLVVGFSC